MLFAVLMTAAKARAADFNGDGIIDLLFRDHRAANARLSIVLGARGAAGGGAQRSITLSSSTARTLGFEVRAADFDADGRSDLLDRDLGSGRFRIRLMNGTSIRAQATPSGLPTGTELQTIADFTGDRRADLLLRDKATGAWNLYAMSGLAVDTTRSGPVAAPAAPDWQLVAAADFNGDGRTDLLLRRTDTLAWRMLQLDGKRVLRASAPAFLPVDPAWHLESITDFNRDGRADLLFRSSTTGVWQMWLLNGDLVLGNSGRAGIAESLLWKLQFTADLNADGYPDALLARPDTGDWRVEFLMGRYRLAGSGLVQQTPRPAARIAAAGDYDGDGLREVLVDTPEGWQIVALDNPPVPEFRVLDLPAPGIWSLACEPPGYRQFGHPPRPLTADASYAFLSWTLPRTRENGEALCANELVGYQIQYARIGSGAAQVQRIADRRAEARLIGPLAAGTWAFRIRSFDRNGVFSQSSPEMRAIIP